MLRWRGIYFIVTARHHVLSHEFKRALGKVTTPFRHNIPQRALSLTICKCADDEAPSDGTVNPKIRRVEKRPRRRDNMDEMKEAVVKVAKSLRGDWTKTADELMARLESHQRPKSQTEAPQEEEEVVNEQAPGTKSLLSTMQVGRSMDRKGPFRVRSRWATPSFGEDIEDNRQQRQQREDGFPRQRLARKAELFTDLYSEPRLGIFDAEKIKADKESQQLSDGWKDKRDLWQQLDWENMKKMQGGLPRNAFEEMLEWTREGKMWSFPIDNEADMDEERKYKFYDHIFLEKHLTDFPDQGPIRKFMELVVIGLSKNSWMAVPEKVEHIRWFGEYFREKQDVLESSIGEHGKMKDLEQEKLE